MSTLAATFAAPVDTPGAALSRYWRLLEGQKRRLVAAAAVHVVKHSPAVLLPVITGYAVDLLAQKAPPQQIVEGGRHDALLARCALYRRLWQPEEGTL